MTDEERKQIDDFVFKLVLRQPDVLEFAKRPEVGAQKCIELLEDVESSARGNKSYHTIWKNKKRKYLIDHKNDKHHQKLEVIYEKSKKEYERTVSSGYKPGFFTILGQLRKKFEGEGEWQQKADWLAGLKGLCVGFDEPIVIAEVEAAYAAQNITEEEYDLRLRQITEIFKNEPSGPMVDSLRGYNKEIQNGINGKSAQGS